MFYVSVSKSYWARYDWPFCFRTIIHAEPHGVFSTLVIPVKNRGDTMQGMFH